MARNDLWTREQLIMALNVYFKIPFKDVKEKHPLIQKYALSQRAWHRVMFQFSDPWSEHYFNSPTVGLSIISILRPLV